MVMRRASCVVTLFGGAVTRCGFSVPPRRPCPAPQYGGVEEVAAVLLSFAERYEFHAVRLLPIIRSMRPQWVYVAKH